MPLLVPSAPYALLEDGTSGIFFQRPKRWITARHADDVENALIAVEAACADGQYAMGYLRYEAAQAFHPKLKTTHNEPDAPLLCFGIFEEPETLDGPGLEVFWQQKTLKSPSCSGVKTAPRWTAGRYAQKMSTVLNNLITGNIYQANLTFPLDLDVTGSAEALYARLRRNQPAPYSAFISFEEDLILSLSPERFFTIIGDKIDAQPMKGTAPIDSPGAGEALRADPKNRAENLMITDLLRNDLSQIAEPGSVDVPALFDIERLPSVYQMTSHVTATRRPGVTLYDVMAALFPCGSVTGAPKLSAMQTIDRLETAPRGIYCGAIGMIKPNGDMTFSVPIRTVTQRKQKLQMAIGSGVVADSQPNAEYAECLLKGKFLSATRPHFSLIETMRWDPDQPLTPQHWPLHAQRLTEAARFFGFANVPNSLLADMATLLSSLPKHAHKLRLLYGKHGTASVTASLFEPAQPEADLTVRLGTLPKNCPIEFLRYKTTNRWAYETAMGQARAHGACDEVFLIGTDGLLCEGSYTNIFMTKNGTLLTPRASGAFLPGVLRTHLLETGKAKEADLTPEDLAAADEVFAGNALRGLRRAVVLQ